MIIPNHVKGTPVEKLLKQIEHEAQVRGLSIRRDAPPLAGAIYMVLDGGKETTGYHLGGIEGKTLRAESSKMLRKLLADLRALPLPTEDTPVSLDEDQE